VAEAGATEVIFHIRGPKEQAEYASRKDFPKKSKFRVIYRLILIAQFPLDD